MSLGDKRQRTPHLLMVRPLRFGPNAETAASNRYQRAPRWADAELCARAWAEFDACVDALVRAGAEPIVIADAPGPPRPDAVFPNNWVSFHGDGTTVLYPLAAQNRRLERRPDILRALQDEHGFAVGPVLDISGLEARHWYLEGTGSLVLDRIQHIAYAAISSRTDPRALAEFARLTGYRPVAFGTSDGDRGPVYHTNVVMSVGTDVAILCSAAIPEEDRHLVRDELGTSGRDVVEITQEQMGCFAGNALEIEAGGDPVLVLSRTALASLGSARRAALERHARLLPVAIEMIEQVGGGSVRCMLADIHLPRLRAVGTALR